MVCGQYLRVASGPSIRFLMKNGRDSTSVTQLSKFRTSSGWIMRCVVWPVSGGRYYIHIPMGPLEQGWLSFHRKLKGSLKHGEFECWQESQRKAMVQTWINFSLPESPSSKSNNFSYAKIVKKNSMSQTSVSLWEKQSTFSLKKSNGILAPVAEMRKQSMNLVWIMKNHDVLEEDFSNLWTLSRLFIFNEWKDIAMYLEEIFKAKIIINPLFADNALIKIDQGRLEELIETPGKWHEFGPSHLLFEKWNKDQHSRPLVTKGFGGWISIKNLPLDYWRSTFEAIKAYFGGMEAITT